MEKQGEKTGLFSLPLEIRRTIILVVLKCGRRKEPTPDQEVWRPETTNIYVQRHKNRLIHGNGLVATCRQLRSETFTLIKDTLKPGLVDVPFVLDVMVVKHVGVILTWMSFPYKPLRIRKLTVNVRVMRSARLVVPDDWVDAARYKADEHDFEDKPPSETPPLDAIEAVAVREAAPSAVVDAYLRDWPSYTVDEMVIDWHPYEPPVGLAMGHHQQHIPYSMPYHDCGYQSDAAWPAAYPRDPSTQAGMSSSFLATVSNPHAFPVLTPPDDYMQFQAFSSLQTAGADIWPYRR
ncbi:hypothetical protein NLG97_g8188 [Lecanicillium saksenae]|uniref:Uncharacterized protein n=1 Tax=Lecanicillium saksenae TaxID=468837 RepID=A0ACC1QL03_9HYPO|nr:hypothetical protein NLG97_g8188 [Lecanicillium saksenae]